MVQLNPNSTIRRQRSDIPDILGNSRNNRTHRRTVQYLGVSSCCFVLTIFYGAVRSK